MELEEGTSGRGEDRRNQWLSKIRQNLEDKLQKFWMLKFFDRRTTLGNWTFLTFCLLACVNHSMFCELPEIRNENDNRKCLQINKVRRTEAITWRSFIDFFYFIYSIAQLYADSKGNAADLKGNLTKGNPTICSWLLFLVDVFIILPFPQALIMSRLKVFMSAFPFLLVQLILRIIRMSPHLGHIKRKSISRRLQDQILAFDPNIGRYLEGLLFVYGVAIFFLYYYLTAGSVFGSLWYYFAIKKIKACWTNFIKGKENGSFYCDDPSSGNYTFLDGLCLMKTPNETIYDFGIYSEALESGIVLEIKTAFNWKRSTYCLRWGLQSLSSFGQGLQPRTGVKENIFVISIAIVGVLLLVFSVGLVEMIIENQFTRSAKRESKEQEIRQCRILRKLPEDFRKEIKEYLLDDQVEMTKGIDVENLVNYLSNDLQTKIKHELCLPLLKRVQPFSEWEEALLKELCNYVKLVSYTAHTRIVHMGDPVDKMIFVLQGELWTYTTNVNRTYSPYLLKNGDFCGKELLDKIQNYPNLFNLPISDRAIVAHKDVEAFALMAFDLQTVFAKNMSPEERKTQPVEPQ